MQVDNHGSGSAGAPGGPIPGLMFNLRKAILEVMKQMTKTQKFVNKTNLFDLLKDKVDGGMPAFEKELESMMNDGEVTTAFDLNHLCLTG